MNEQYTYPGQELAVFEKAINWKAYFSSYIKAFIGKKVLEVGGGIGSNTPYLNHFSTAQWIILEPDMHLSNELKLRLAQQPYSNCSVSTKTIHQLNATEKFDTIIYIDVLEHIEDDETEMDQAAQLLNPGGYVIVLSPAFQYLYSPFDKAIGHYRRYTTRTLKRIMPPELEVVQLQYLDSIGFFASLANKLLLQQNYPTTKQVKMWDNYMIPVSKWTDKIFLHSFGKSILGIWRKN